MIKWIERVIGIFLFLISLLFWAEAGFENMFWIVCVFLLLFGWALIIFSFKRRKEFTQNEEEGTNKSRLLEISKYIFILAIILTILAFQLNSVWGRINYITLIIPIYLVSFILYIIGLSRRKTE